MKKIILLFKLHLFLLIIVTGCWSSRELTDLAIALGLGIDKNEQGEFVVSVQIINPSEIAGAQIGSGGYDTPATTYSATGEILFEALRKLSTKIPRKVYLAHLRIIVIGEEVAKDGIYDVLDFLSRDHELRTDFYIVISKESTAEDTLEILTSIEKIPANKLFFSLEKSAEVWAATGKIKLNELMDEIVSEGIQPALTGVKIEGNPKDGRTMKNIERITPKTYLSNNGIAAFRKNKLVGWLTEEESKGFNYIKGNVESTIIVFDMNDDQIGVELIRSKTDIVPQINNGDVSIDINVTGEANIADVNTKLDLMNPNVIGELESKINKQVKNVIESAVEKVQKEYESDIFGFGERIHKKEPKEWEKLKNEWDELFPSVPVNIKSSIKIRRIGTISNPFHKELKKE